MTLEEAIKAELSKGIHAQLTDIINKAVRKGYDKAMAELTHCKDCKHWQCDDEETYCDELGIFGTDMNSYCSYAKRKEE